MTTQTNISWEQIKELLPPSTNLYYVDYRDNLDDSMNVIQECIKAKSLEPLYALMDGCEPDYGYCVEALKGDIEAKYELSYREASAIVNEYYNEILDELDARDESNLMQDLLRNTSDIKLRVTMYSNYDCINSHWFESQSGYSYKESYFGAIVDALKLNPAKIKELLLVKGIKAWGSFPNYSWREGKEFVSYEDFWQEVENQSCGACNLVFVAKLKATDLPDFINANKIVIPKGNNCGLFSSFQGGGSVIEMQLKRY